jgi:hypothetical protein
MTGLAPLNVGDRVALADGTHGTIVVVSSTGGHGATAVVESWTDGIPTHSRVPTCTLTPVYRLLDHVLVKGMRLQVGGYTGHGAYWVFDPGTGTRFDADADHITPAIAKER